MASNPNIGPTPPPLQTPIIQGASAVAPLPWHLRPENIGGSDEANASSQPAPLLVNVAWAGYFTTNYARQILGAISAGTRANRLSLPLQPNANTLYYETDTGLTYAAFSYVANITGATNANPIVIAAINQFINGDQVIIAGVGGNLAANGTRSISAVSPTGFTLTGIAGSGAYTSGGTATGPLRWYYVGGTYSTPQAGISAFIATLTEADTGLLIKVTDYAHVLQWNGTTLQYSNSSDVPGRIDGFLVDPPSPDMGWQLCDGTTGVNYLLTDGTLGSIDLPDLISVPADAAYLKLGSPASATVNPAVSPGFTGAGSTTGPTSGGTPSGTISAITATATAAVNVTSSGAVQVAAEAHTHPAPTLTFAALAPHSHSIPALSGTVDDTGEPQNIVLRPWFRQ